ncbi:MAG: hypothetical protein AAB444_00820 [Patescibacteria group bacterium]
MRLKKDTRKITWKELEKDIQIRARRKDARFSLRGAWKKFLRKQEGFMVFEVDGDWVRANLSIIFGHGGHGLVHEFIPHRAIWVSARHFKNCGCRGVARNQHMSPRMTASTTLHEIREYQEMKKGRAYWPAHQMALEAERKAGFLDDPFQEDYTNF